MNAPENNDHSLALGEAGPCRKLHEQFADLFGLFLLHPVPGSIQEIESRPCVCRRLFCILSTAPGV